MNMIERRICKLEAIAGLGEHKPYKLMIFDIRDNVKTLRCEQILLDYPKHKQRKDIIVNIYHIKPNTEDELIDSVTRVL